MNARTIANQIPGFLYRYDTRIDYYNSGRLKDGSEVLYVDFKNLQDDEKRALEKALQAEFGSGVHIKLARSEYAPEQIKTIIVVDANARVDESLKESEEHFEYIYAKDVKEGDIVELTGSDKKWKVSENRSGPFGTTLRLNSLEKPVQTKEISVSDYYGVAVYDSVSLGEDLHEDTDLKISVNVFVSNDFEEGVVSGDKNTEYDEQTLEDWYDFAATIEGIIERQFIVENISISKNPKSLSEYIDFYRQDENGDRKDGLVDLRLSDHGLTTNGRQVRKRRAARIDKNYRLISVVVNDKIFDSYGAAIKHIEGLLDGLNECLKEDTILKDRSGRIFKVVGVQDAFNRCGGQGKAITVDAPYGRIYSQPLSSYYGLYIVNDSLDESTGLTEGGSNPIRYITDDVMHMTNSKLLSDELNRDKATIIVKDGKVWYTERNRLSNRAYDILKREMKRLYPELLDLSKIQTTRHGYYE